jgi:hypothetical protein
MTQNSFIKEEKMIDSLVSTSEGIFLLKRQKERGKQLLELSPIDIAHYRAWENTTREFIVKAFGCSSPNIKSLTSIGKYGSFPINGDDQWWNQHTVESLNKQLVMLDSLIDQLETELLLSPKETRLDVLSIIESLCYKFHVVSIQLQERHENRQTLIVNDEYDVQDLFHALLRIFFDDVRDEEWTPSYAGQASRMDFLLKDYATVIEIKKTRAGLGKKEIGNQLIVDIERYKSHPDCNTLICFVYDPESRIKNPRGLESDLNKQVDNLLVKVLVVPRI